MHTVALRHTANAGEWRDAARALLGAGVAPHEVDWRAGEERSLFAESPLSLPPSRGAVARPCVPRAFPELIEAVICHSDPGRFALLYRLLVRLQDERHLLEVASDSDVVAARRMQKSVRRDCHKMKAFVRFREVSENEPGLRRRRFVAWFEPDHHIVARTAPFAEHGLCRMTVERAACAGQRFPMQGVKHAVRGQARLFLPPGLKAFVKGRRRMGLLFRHRRDTRPRAGDETGDKRGFRQIFPVFLGHLRLHGLHLQPCGIEDGGVIGCPQRIGGIRKIGLFRRSVRNRQGAALEGGQTFRRQDDPVHVGETAGEEGPPNAELMMVGEQPGDREDLAGRPFVGPAGQLLDRMMSQAGIERRKVYVTNAVKHFKFELRGKKRLHRSPGVGEVEQCRWWLTKELDLVRPRLVVAMGATALQALTGGKARLADMRGRIAELKPGLALLVTVHPAYLLRIGDACRAKEETRRFLDDLTLARRWLKTDKW